MSSPGLPSSVINRGHSSELVFLRVFMHSVAVCKHRRNGLFHYQDLPQAVYIAIYALSFTSPGFITNNTLEFLGTFCLKSWSIQFHISQQLLVSKQIQTLSKSRTYSKLACSIPNSPSKAGKPSQKLKLQGRNVLAKTTLLLLLYTDAWLALVSVPLWGHGQTKHYTLLGRQVMGEMRVKRWGVPKHRKFIQTVSSLTKSELLYKRSGKNVYVNYLPISLSQPANTRITSNLYKGE